MDTDLCVIQDTDGRFWDNSQYFIRTTVTLPYTKGSQPNIIFTNKEAKEFIERQSKTANPCKPVDLQIRKVFFNKNNTMVFVTP